MIARSFDRRLVAALLLLALGWVATACGGREPIQIGAKPFAEQKILANALDMLLEQRGFETRRIKVCNDTYDCERRLQSGRIDLMVEYSGTAFRLFGKQVPATRSAAYDKLREIYEPLGITWSTRLGFENHYVWMMPRDRAIARDIESLDDLAEAPPPVTVATPPEYVRRSRDGLMATAQRYGIDVAPEPLVIQDAMKRYEATLDGRADVLVGYSTDGALETFGMRRLTDNLDFFPPYEATVAIRTAALEGRSGLESAVGELENKFDAKTMRRLNYAVDVEGRAPRSVARRFLETNGIVEFTSKATETVPTIEIAVDPAHRLAPFESRAVNSVRKVFSDRAVELTESDAPKESVFRGKTRLAILGAEEFFERDRKGEFERTDRADALVVLGDRMLHVLRRTGASDGPALLSGAIGTTRSSACDDFLSELGAEAQLRAGPKKLVSKLEAGEIDTAVILAEPGHTAVADAMASGKFELVDIGGDQGTNWRFSLPYLRPVRITPDTYPNQSTPVDTMAAQVLLAGAPQNRRASDNANGPAAGVDTTGHPVSLERVNALADALGIDQAPDPALPSVVHVTRANGNSNVDSWFDGGALDTILNIGIFIFLGWLGFIVLIEPKSTPDAESSSDSE